MKKEKYIVEIEMPDGDVASSMYIHDVIQSDCDIEDEGRWKVSVKEYWKPSEGQLECLGYAIEKAEKDWSPLINNRIYLTLKALKEQLEKL